jgi:DNA-binding transcriptional LysR family regulator
MNLECLETFVSVVDCGAVSEAARQQGITQPAATKRIRRLESQLGVRLFSRIGHDLIPTEAARQLLPHARKMIKQAEHCRLAVQTTSGAVEGNLILAASHHISLYRLPPVLKSFTTLHPAVRLDLRFTESEEAYELVKSGRVDLALITLPRRTHEQLIMEKVWDDPLEWVAAPDHPLCKNHPEPLDTEHLLSYPAILPERDTFTRRQIESAIQPAPLLLFENLRTNNLETIRMLVACGLGWSLLPATMVTPDLCRLKVAGLRIRRELGIVRHRERVPGPAASHFMETLAAHL